MAQEIGTAYVTVQPSARGLGKRIEGEIGGGADKGTKTAGGKIKALAKKVAKWGVASVVATGAAITGLALKGGFSRALNIENAQAKLKGLGHDAKSVDQIMTDALASVKGTAYGLDEAAVTAASAVASGIKPGKELARYLTLAADAATIAGVSMGEMGDILNKVTAKGKVSMNEINMMTARGVPILEMLADEYGVTAEEMSKMVSKGEVDAERFRKALENNVAGAALESGDTTEGAFANMGAALSRLGVTIIDPFFEHFKTVFSEITVFIDGVNDRLQPFVEKFKDAFGDKIAGALDGAGEKALGFLDRILGITKPITDVTRAVTPMGMAFSALGPLIEGAKGGLTGFLDAIPAALGVIIDNLMNVVQTVIPTVVDWLVSNAPTILEAGITMLMGLIGAVAEIIPLLVDALVTLIPTVLDVIVSMLPLVLDAGIQLLMGLVEAAITVIPELVQAVVTLLPQLFEAIISMLPMIIEAGLTLLGGLIEALITIIPELIGMLVELLPLVADAIVQALPLIVEGAIELFMGLVHGLLDVLPVLLTEIIGLLPVIVESLLSLLPALLEAAIELFLALVLAVLEIVPDLIGTIIGLLPIIVAAILEMLPAILEAAIDLFIALVDAIPIILPQLLDAIIKMLPTIVERIISMLPAILDAAIQLFMALVEAIPRILPKLLNALLLTAPKIIGALLSLIPQLLSTGVEVFLSLATAVKDAVPEILSSLGQLGSDLVQKVVDFIPAMLNAGKRLLSGLADGIRAGISKAVGAVSNGLSRIRSFLPFSPAKRGPFSGKGWTLYSGESIMDAMADGIRDKQGVLVASVRGAVTASHAVLNEWDGGLSLGANGDGYAAGAGFGAGVQYVDNRTVYNPVAEPDSIQVERNLQKAAAYVGGLA